MNNKSNIYYNAFVIPLFSSDVTFDEIRLCPVEFKKDEVDLGLVSVKVHHEHMWVDSVPV